MKEREKTRTFNVHNTDELRQMIIDNPDLPLVVLADEAANPGDYLTMFCSSIHAEIGEILDCNQEINDEICYTDREQFEEDIFDKIDILTGYDDRPNEWYEQEAQRIASEYEPYWRKCILLTVGN